MLSNDGNAGENYENKCNGNLQVNRKPDGTGDVWYVSKNRADDKVQK
jgi:hypothetical protein